MTFFSIMISQVIYHHVSRIHMIAVAVEVYNKLLVTFK